MIETRQAVESLDEILAVPGIEAIYVGPADLSLSYGLPPAVDQAGEVFEALSTASSRPASATAWFRGSTPTRCWPRTRHAVGFRMITVGVDAASAIAALHADVAAARAAIES